MIAHFIRHGESKANIGLACSNHTQIELTSLGFAQADAVARAWKNTPNLVVVSSFLRAQQTAGPTIQRFPDIPVEPWPVHEFTYLDPHTWNGTTPQLRKPAVESYWRSCDPHHRDGADTESFSQLLRRVEGVLLRLRALPQTYEVLVFSHQQFIQAALLTLAMPNEDDPTKMSEFLAFGKTHFIPNGSVIPFNFGDF